MGRIGNDDLHRHRTDPYQEGCDQKRRRMWRECCGRKGKHRHGDGADDQLAVFHEIAERHDKQQTDTVTDLCQGHDQPRRASGKTKLRTDDAGKRLTIIKIGRDQSAGCRQQESQSRGNGWCLNIIPINHTRRHHFLQYGNNRFLNIHKITRQASWQYPPRPPCL